MSLNAAAPYTKEPERYNWNENGQSDKFHGSLQENGLPEKRTENGETQAEATENGSESFIDMLRRKEAKELPKDEPARSRRVPDMDYDPWGRPGAGAPRLIDNRLKKFTEVDLQLDRKCNGNLEGLNFYRPGAGAPNVSQSGEPLTDRRGDPALRYRNIWKEHPHRYCMSPEKAEEFISELKSEQIDKLQREKDERELNWRADQQHVKRNPFGRRGSGVQHTPRVDRPPPAEVSELTLPLGHSRGHGAPIYDENGQQVTKLKQSLVFEDGKAKAEALLQEDPLETGRSNPNLGFLSFGSPGGGSPRRDPKGNRVAALESPREDEETLRQRRYRQHLLRQAEKDLLMRELDRKKREHEASKYNHQSITTEMMRSVIGKARRDPDTSALLDQHRLRTDLGETLRKFPKWNEETPRYQQDLLRQMHARRVRDDLDRTEDRMDSNFHYQQSPRVFGLPGGGAPNHQYDHRKPNLTNLLNMPHSTDHPIVPHSPGLEIRSSHVNMYEWPFDHRKYDSTLRH